MHGRMNNLLPYELSKEGKKKENKGNYFLSFLGFRVYHTHNQGSRIMDSKVAILLLRIYAFYEEERHAIMGYPFVPFHIRSNIATHVELQNVAITLIHQP